MSRNNIIYSYIIPCSLERKKEKKRNKKKNLKILKKESKERTGKQKVSKSEGQESIRNSTHS